MAATHYRIAKVLETPHPEEVEVYIDLEDARGVVGMKALRVATAGKTKAQILQEIDAGIKKQSQRIDVVQFLGEETKRKPL